METGDRSTRMPSMLGSLAVAFGALTLLAGGSVLFGPPSVREAAGNIVLPVLWFNFLSGPVYILAGWAILRRSPVARLLTGALAAAIAALLALLVVLILAGTPWEPRTLVAMTFRLAFWLVIRRLLWSAKGRRREAPPGTGT